ncbi:arginine--tRNA ligase, partial [Streptococcus pyogenes]
MDTKTLIASEIAKVVPELEQDAIFNLLETPKNSDMGDLAFPAFSLAKVLRKAPQMIASELAEQIDESQFEKVVAVGPYINFFLDKTKISSQVLEQVITADSDYAQQDEGQGRNVAIDMSSPNIAKPFSIGHLRSTVIGDSLAHIFAKMGYKPVKINHLGDWGKQFGMLIVAYKKWGDEAAVQAHPIDELLKLYVRINAEAETDPTVDEEAREWFRKLEDGDKEATELWQWFRDESLLEFNRLYDQLHVTFDSYNGEAFYNDKMDEVLDLLEAKNLLVES